MRFTHYMWYLVMLEGGKLIPNSGFFWRPLLYFSRGVLTTIYSTSWWWPPARRICPCVFLHVQCRRFGRGRHSCHFWILAHLDQKIAIFWIPRSTISGRVGTTKSSPTAVHGPTQPRRAKWAQPPSNQSTIPEPSIIQPNTRSPACSYLCEDMVCSLIFQS